MFSIDRAEIFIGAPYKLKDICKIYQLTLEEICLQEDCMGFGKYNYYINLFTIE